MCHLVFKLIASMEEDEADKNEKKRKKEIEMRKIGGKRGVLPPIWSFQIKKAIFNPTKPKLHFTNFSPFSER